MSDLENKVDILLSNQKNETGYSQELISAVERILIRNDSLPRASVSRVSIERAVSFFRDNGYECSRHSLKKIAIDKLGRKGWANA